MSDATQFRTLSVLMPVFNERWTLDLIVERVLSSPVELDIELVIVDDCSTDGSWQRIQELAERDPRIQAVRHATNGGKGTAIRTAIAHMTGDVAVVQDADLEYDPHEFPRLLAPILAGKADAVFGSRYAGAARRVPRYWHTQVNRLLTFMSNLCSGLMLTDMETCYKMVRADLLRCLHLTSATFTLEPEIAMRLAQHRARIYEVPISYAARSFDEGKKIRPIDGLKAIGAMLRYRFLDRRFTTDQHLATLAACDGARSIQQALASALSAHLGSRVLQLSSGLGTLGGHWLDKERVILSESNPAHVERIGHRFAARKNLTIEQSTIVDPEQVERWRREQIDTILFVDWLGQTVEPAALDAARRALADGGRLVLCLPHHEQAEQIDRALRRCDFDIVHTQPLLRIPKWIARWLPPDPVRRMQMLNRIWPVARRLTPGSSGVGMYRLVVAQRRDFVLRRLAA